MMMDATAHAILRAPFPAEKIGKLPRVTCPDCVKKNCSKHAKERCKECGAWVSQQHVHLDYVGHADVTDRLLAADLAWTWEPLAFDADGLPAVVERGSEAVLWIRLTVAGITRLGVGSVAANSFDRDKQLIGDALRNAAMRFGVALDLWHKHEVEPPPVSPKAKLPDGHMTTTAAKTRLIQALAETDDPRGLAAEVWAGYMQGNPATCSTEDLDAMLAIARGQ